MPIERTPIYALRKWAGPQAQPWVGHDEALLALEAAVRGSVLDRDLDAAPGTCVDGACFLVAATPGGGDPWEGETGSLALAVGVNAANGWIFITIATEGQFLWVEDEAIRIQYAGAVWGEVTLGVTQQVTLTASEAITAGDFVNIHASSGAKIQLANATDDTKPCDGYCPASIANTASGKVYVPGQVISGLSGLTPGDDYFLDTTGGAITATAPSSSGNLVQKVGKALSATTLLFFPTPGVTL